MTLEYYINRIKLELTGGVLQTEIDDKGFKDIINIALQDLNRYYDQTQLIESDSSSCIDLTALEEKAGVKINNVAHVYRTNAVGSTSSGMGSTDPMSVAY